MKSSFTTTLLYCPGSQNLWVEGLSFEPRQFGSKVCALNNKSIIVPLKNISLVNIKVNYMLSSKSF